VIIILSSPEAQPFSIPSSNKKTSSPTRPFSIPKKEKNVKNSQEKLKEFLEFQGESYRIFACTLMGCLHNRRLEKTNHNTIKKSHGKITQHFAKIPANSTF
jgi:hypothetical protein